MNLVSLEIEREKRYDVYLLMNQNNQPVNRGIKQSNKWAILLMANWNSLIHFVAIDCYCHVTYLLNELLITTFEHLRRVTSLTQFYYIFKFLRETSSSVSCR